MAAEQPSAAQAWQMTPPLSEAVTQDYVNWISNNTYTSSATVSVDGQQIAQNAEVTLNTTISTPQVFTGGNWVIGDTMDIGSEEGE